MSQDIGALTRTWNDVGTTFYAISIDVTATAYAPGSMIQRWRVNGSDVVVIKANGRLAGFDGGLGAGSNGFVVESTLIAGGYTFSIGAHNFTAMYFTFGGAPRVIMCSDTVHGWGSRTAISEPNAPQLVASLDTALGRNSAGVVEVNNGTNGTLADILARSFKNTPVAVASLPSAATLGSGARAFVNNALTPAFGSAVVGGGAVAVPVYSDGTNWIVG